MNKKFMNALLFSAALLSAGVVTSCKDYDDDIDELRNQDEANKADLTQQLEAVNSSISSLQSAQTGLQSDIEAAEKAVQEAQASADEAAIAAAEAKQAALEGQQAAIDEAAKSLTAAKEELTSLIQQGDNALQEDIDAVEAALTICQGHVEALLAFQGQTEETLAELDKAYQELNTTVKGISAKVEDLLLRIGKAETAITSQEAALKSYQETNDVAIDDIQADLSALAAQVEKWKGLDPAELEAMGGEIEQAQQDIISLNNDIAAINKDIATLYTAVYKGVTYVSLYVGKEYDDIDGVQNIWDNSELTLLSAKAVRSWIFGENVVNNPVQFTKCERINRTKKFLVRVSPANATIENSDLQFIDSEGNDLIEQGIITATIKPYDGVLTAGNVTRAAVGTGNGLFEVAVSINNPYDEAKFQAATQLDGEKPADPSKYRAFALGIKDNTVKDMERNVVSEYALTFGLPGDKTVGKLDFTVNDVDAGIIQNRATLPTLVDKDAKEYEWLNKVGDEPIFEGADKNVKEGDDRTNFDPLNVEAFEPFTIQLSDKVMETATHFYVVVDYGFVNEADDDTEGEVWERLYESNITGINTMYDVAETNGKAEISFNYPITGSDIIGFRVYAVNSNGTLVDPDGRSFYVRVGSTTSSLTWDTSIKANIDQTKMVSNKLELGEDVLKAISQITDKIDINSSTWDASFEGVNLLGTVYGRLSSDAFKLNFYDSKDNLLNPEANAADWKKVAKIEAEFQQPASKLIDDQVYQGVYTLRDAKNNVLYTITVNVTKTLPTGMPADFKPKTEQPFANGVYTCYVDWNKNSTDPRGEKDLASVFYGLKIEEDKNVFDEAYTFTFADSQAGAKEGEFEDVNVFYNAANGYKLSVDDEFVSDGKEHALTVTYDYGTISFRLSDDGRSYETDNVEVENTDYAFKYVCAYDVQSWSWKKDYKGNVLTYRKAGTMTSDDIQGISSVDAKYNQLLTEIRKSDELAANTATVKLYGTKGNVAGVENLDESRVNEYFIPSISHANYVATINFKPNDAATSDPGKGKVVNCVLRITYVDMFGHDVNIDLPVTVKSAIPEK